VDFSRRWIASSAMNPFITGFSEKMLARPETADDGYLVRGLAGIAFPGKSGEFSFYLSIDKGNGKGLLINTKENRITSVLRYCTFVR